MKFKLCRLCCVKNISVTTINFIVDEYDGEVLDKTKAQRECVECYKLKDR